VPERANLLWQLRIACAIAAKVNDSQTNTVLHFTFAEIVQPGRPFSMFVQIIGDVFKEQDVTGIAAIHHSLRHVNPTTGDVGAPANISYFTNRAAMNSHPHGNLGMSLE
jgi:hypothetical protein